MLITNISIKTIYIEGISFKLLAENCQKFLICQSTTWQIIPKYFSFIHKIF